MNIAKEMDGLRPKMVRLAKNKLGMAGMSESEAEDIVQEAFIIAWGRIGAFNQADGVKGLKAWLFQVVDNVCRYRIRSAIHLDKWLERPIASRYMGEGHLLDNVADFSDVEEMALDNLAKSEDRDKLYGLIASCSALSCCERKALLLRLEGDLSHSELGSTLGLSEGAARVLYCRAVSKLRAAMKDVGA